MVLERKSNGNFEKNRKGDDLSDEWCEAIRSKKLQGVDGLLGIKESLDKMAKASSMQCSVPTKPIFFSESVLC